MSETPTESSEILVELRNLRTHVFTDMGVAKSVDGVSYAVRRGKTLGVVGESGCGKSVTALSIMGLIPQPPGKIVSGEILFKGQDLTKLDKESLRKLRGNDIAMIFQEPMTSLNPVYTVGDRSPNPSSTTAKTTAQSPCRAIKALEEVESPPEKRVDETPSDVGRNASGAS